jgi:hypothetical protein
MSLGTDSERPDHPSQVRQTPDVRLREDRSFPSPPYRRAINPIVSTGASESSLQTDLTVIRKAARQPAIFNSLLASGHDGMQQIARL